MLVRYCLMPYLSFLNQLLFQVLRTKMVITDTDNYSLIAITSVGSKFLELLLLDILQFQLDTYTNQFGFKARTVQTYGYNLKQIPEYYNQCQPSLYLLS